MEERLILVEDIERSLIMPRRRKQVLPRRRAFMACYRPVSVTAGWSIWVMVTQSTTHTIQGADCRDVKNERTIK